MVAPTRLARLTALLVVAWASCGVVHSQAPSSIALRLINGETGKPIDGAIVIGYWSKNPPPNLGCIGGALIGLPVHCSGIPIVMTATEARSDENGQANLPDSEQRGWEPTAAHWLRIAIFKDGYQTASVGRNDWHEPRKSLCIPEQAWPQGAAEIAVFVFPLMSHCQYPANRAPTDHRTEAERRWDSARQFASSIEEAVRGAEDRDAVVIALRQSIAGVDSVLLNARPSTQQSSAWSSKEVLTVVREVRGQPKFTLRLKEPAQSATQSVIDGRAP